jgi:signal transduction histidine kinase
MLFLDPERGLVGEALAGNRPLYSGDRGEAGYLIPGIRLPRVAVFPARYRDQNWGFLLLSSEQPGWFYAYRDVLEILAQEVALAAAAADVAEKSRQQQMTEDRARMQSDILANVSHELRTPLGLVRGYLETLIESHDKLEPDVQQEFLAVSLEETRELESLIEKLLTMSRMEYGMNLHQPDWFDPDNWIARALARHPRQAQERIRIENRARGERVFGDPRSLTTVLSDLLDNALKYSPGPIDVVVERRADAWSVVVRDFGPGVAPTDEARVFERFFRAAAHAKSEVRGSGLGLSIAQHIVEMHGGSIKAENAAGGGFRVHFTLPVNRRSLGSLKQKGVDSHGRRRVGAGHR